MQTVLNEVPSWVRNAIRIYTAFVTWVALKSWFNPLSLENINNFYVLDPELMNFIGRWTIPACFGVIVYFLCRYYDRKVVDDIHA